MRIARVIGTVTLGRQVPDLKPGRYLIAEALDGRALKGLDRKAPREKPMPESLIVFDDMGVGVGQIIAVSEGREACMPWYPEKVPVDAYAAAILDQIELITPQPAVAMER
ncbi:MAG: EutN/CcmL family microcompartment protein [Planctomycetes bacterium]|nr:EutN/CcmL family microcompartment protein [Planctomycetota bacterium]